MDGIIELLGYIAVGIFVIFNRLYRRKKTNENDYGLTEDGKLKLPFINELIEPETEPVPEQKELIPDEIEVVDQDEILDDPIAFEPNMASYSEQKSDELEPNHPFIDFKRSNARQAIIYSEILRPPKSLR